MLAEHRSINSRPRKTDDKLEHVICALIVYADMARVASFGGASLWPEYLYFANQTKYELSKPSSCAAHHFAYFPSVSLYFSPGYF